MARIKNFVAHDDKRDNLKKIEKIKKEKRSVRGRVVDDWIIDAPNAHQSKSEIQATIEDLYTKGMRRGRVIEVQKRNVFIAEENEKGMPETENLWLCSVAKRHFQRAHRERNFVVVGDRVLFEPSAELQFDDEGQPVDTDLPRGVVQHSFARTSKISRKDPMRPDWEHVMLANIDLVAIVASVLHPEVRWGLIDRFLVQAEMEKIPVVIILNKVDLLSNEKLASKEFVEIYKRRVEIYRNIGYDVVELCALKPKKNPESVKHLRKLFKGKLVGFAGHSGVGKSSILNLMKPEFEQIVDENPDIFYKGRHTTTYNSLLQLDIGAYAIDTPGIRSFHISNYDPISLSYCFPEFRPFKCKYRECAHDHEPQCGIKQAVSEEKISPERYRSYLGILKGLSFREGEGDSTDATMIADLKAREQKRDEELAKEESLLNQDLKS
ncbi:ribosome small subunit-dependent GTPase A [Silvanigrella aquatica]|uniref:Small ribosomal subunit biogenesis GTPase RsgA n=1 Tax=Silvanigrella aquatica TaxID=1915309 RepID=A0A1L4CZR4_9BACT|nr:ribosome small subunit-dependent GTPase A [Silvanigrella aquatica]APJ03453.1 ribosome small subunit-dependent GTPase A [Silvanigrella aquatica]